MTTYQAVTSEVPPSGTGNSKQLYSPDLFDTTTGDYPMATPPSTATYPPVSDKIPFFESAEPVTTGYGYIQATLAGAAGGPNGYWDGNVEIYQYPSMTPAGTLTFKEAQRYEFTPAITAPDYLPDCISQIVYSDATETDPGGNQKTELIPSGDYAVVFQIYRTYTEATPVQHPPVNSGRGLPATFSETDTTTISTMEVLVTVADGETAIAAFTLA